MIVLRSVASAMARDLGVPGEADRAPRRGADPARLDAVRLLRGGHLPAGSRTRAHGSRGWSPTTRPVGARRTSRPRLGLADPSDTAGPVVAIRVYIAMLTGYDDHGRAHAPDPSSADGTWGKALFVLRPDGEGQTSRILYKLPWATYHAYNGTGYGSLYAEAVWRQSGDREGYKVTTQRPGGGTGGLVMVGDSPDFHAPRSRRQCFAHWDAPFIAWLEGRGYAVDYCTDLDLHQDASVMNGYRLLLSVGHDEYWSDELRAAIEGHIATGGNVAFFSGNIAGWCVHFVDDDTAMVCAKLPPEPRDPRSDQWQQLNPENGVTGVSFYDGGGWWDGKRERMGYRLQHAGHWAFAGTGDSATETSWAPPVSIRSSATSATVRRWSGAAGSRTGREPRGRPRASRSSGLLGWARDGPSARPHRLRPWGSTGRRRAASSSRVPRRIGRSRWMTPTWPVSPPTSWTASRFPRPGS